MRVFRTSSTGLLKYITKKLIKKNLVINVFLDMESSPSLTLYSFSKFWFLVSIDCCSFLDRIIGNFFHTLLLVKYFFKSFSMLIILLSIILVLHTLHCKNIQSFTVAEFFFPGHHDTLEVDIATQMIGNNVRQLCWLVVDKSL